MRIERITDLSEILKCLPFEREIRNKGRDRTRESDMLMFIRNQLGNPLFGVWIAYDDKDDILGYCVALLNLFPGIQREYILRIYSKDKKVTSDLVEILSQWAKEYKVKLAQITVNKNIKAMQRIFKFKPISVNMERRI